MDAFSAHCEDDLDLDGFAPTQLLDEPKLIPAHVAAYHARRLIESQRWPAAAARATTARAGDDAYPPTMFGADPPVVLERPRAHRRPLVPLLRGQVRWPFALLLCGALAVALVSALLHSFDQP